MNCYYYVYPVYSYNQQLTLRDTDSPEDVVQLKKSAANFIYPTQELLLLLQHIAYTSRFAEELKVAASLSEEDKVMQIIRSIGVQTPITVKFNPSGIDITFQPTMTEACFNIELRLCW